MTRRRFEPWEYAMIRAQYPHMQTNIIAAMLGRTLSATYQAAQRLGLRKSDTYLATPAAHRLDGVVGASSRFVKGQPAWNKGLRYVAGGRSAETRFRKGQMSGKAAQNYMPVGSTRLIEGYRYIKVADVPNVPYTKNWLPLHTLEWERAHGPVPGGHALVFVNGNREDIRLENLELVSRAELLARNWHRRVPKEVKQITQLRAAIARQINKRTRHGDQPE